MSVRSSGLIGLVVYLGWYATPAEARQRKFTIKNSCVQKVCPGITQTDALPHAKVALPAELGGATGDHLGFCLDPGSQAELIAPSRWKSARLWGRTGCDEQTGKCVTGDCGSDGKGTYGCTGGGVPPATLAEFTLFDVSDNNNDNYDVSLVDGFNIPMSITPSDQRCPPSFCEKNINAKCPDVLRYGIDSKGKNTGCNTACTAGIAEGEWLGTDPETQKPFSKMFSGSMNCCSGPFNTPETCPEMCIDYYNLWHDACPEAYAYAYNDGQGLKACHEAGVEPDYVIEFCAGDDKDFEGNTGGIMDYAGDTADPKCPSNVTVDEKQWKFISGFNADVQLSNGKLAGQGQAGGAPLTEAVLAINPESSTPAAGAGAGAAETSAAAAAAPQPSGSGSEWGPGQAQPSDVEAGGNPVQEGMPVPSQGQQQQSNANANAAAGGNPGSTQPAGHTITSSTETPNYDAATSPAQPPAPAQGTDAPHKPGGPAPVVPIQKQAVQPDAEAVSATETGVAASQPSGETVVQQPDGSVGTTCHKKAKAKRRRNLVTGKGREGLKKHKGRRRRRNS